MKREATTGQFFLRSAALAALGFIACTAAAAPPREILVTREVQDLYRVATGPYYLKTIGCSENVYSDRASLRFNISGKGGMLIFRNGHQCVIERFFEDIEPNKIQIKPSLF